MDAKIWGPYFWFTLHTITLSYPDKPTYENKRHYNDFFINLQQASQNLPFCELILYAQTDIPIIYNKTIKITGNQSLKVTDLLETVREILKIKKKIKVINKKQKGHYTLVPHNYDDKLVMKYSINPFVDLGEGIKSLIIYIKKKKINF